MTKSKKNPKSKQEFYMDNKKDIDLYIEEKMAKKPQNLRVRQGHFDEIYKDYRKYNFVQNDGIHLG